MFSAGILIKKKPVSLGKIVIDTNSLLEWFEEHVGLSKLLFWLVLSTRQHLLADKGDILLHNSGFIGLCIYD